jgi:ATP-dependent helicase/nuclease subunit A
MQSEIWKRAQRSSRRLVEIPFQTLLAPDHAQAAGLPTVLRGTIDLIFEEPAGWVIVDYKTDSDAALRRAELVEHYRGQLRTYADAWQSATRLSVAEIGLYFVSSGEYVACG